METKTGSINSIRKEFPLNVYQISVERFHLYNLERI